MCDEVLCEFEPVEFGVDEPGSEAIAVGVEGCDGPFGKFRAISFGKLRAGMVVGDGVLPELLGPGVVYRYIGMLVEEEGELVVDGGHVGCE